MDIKDFYFAHNFDDRIEFRKIELELEKELGINLFNPFYDDPERGEEMRELDSRNAYAKDRIEQLTKGENAFQRKEDRSINIVRRDIKNLARQQALFTIVTKPSFGTAIEICNAVMMKIPIYFVSELYVQHPWIDVYVDHKFKTLQEFKNLYNINEIAKFYGAGVKI